MYTFLDYEITAATSYQSQLFPKVNINQPKCNEDSHILASLPYRTETTVITHYLGALQETRNYFCVYNLLF